MPACAKQGDTHKNTGTPYDTLEPKCGPIESRVMPLCVASYEPLCEPHLHQLDG
eukprot:m.11238 g.11238  ORF g.11238 m.11238 type:complete len:54 (+) comp8362_c0_seq1:110-271(+)